MENNDSILNQVPNLRINGKYKIPQTELNNNEKIDFDTNGMTYELGIIHHLGTEAEDIVIRNYIIGESPVKTVSILRQKYPAYENYITVNSIKEYVKKNNKLKEAVCVNDKIVAKRSTELALNHETVAIEVLNKAKSILEKVEKYEDYNLANKILKTMLEAIVIHAKLSGKIGADGNTMVNVQINQIVDSVMKDNQSSSFIERIRKRQSHLQYQHQKTESVQWETEPAIETTIVESEK